MAFPTRNDRASHRAPGVRVHLGRWLRGALLWTVGGAVIAAAEAQPFHCPNAWPLRRALIAYDAPDVHYSAQLLDYLAARFEFSDEINAYNVGQLKQRNPNFYALSRNSLSDNFVYPSTQTDEHDWLTAHAADYGVGPEDIYLHFWTDTEIVLEGQSIVVPGWQPGSPKSGATAATRADSRVPVYYKNLTRRATNFSTAPIRALNRAYSLSRVAQPIIGGIHWEGFFFDNAGNYGLVVTIATGGAYPSGGQLAEHPSHGVMNSPAFKDWYWYQGIGLFMKEFREWIAGNPPELGGRRLRIVPNVYNLPYLDTVDWENAYVNFRAGDVLFQEYELNPVRDSARRFPEIIFQKNSLAQASGIELFQPGLSVTAAAPNAGTYTSDEALMSTLSLHWVTRTSNVLILGHQSNAVMRDDWPQNTKAIFDVDLGPPLGDPYVLATGTDGHSPAYPYTIYAREFSCGLAIVRERGTSNEDIDPTTSTVVQLPRQYIPVDADGNTGYATSQWDLRNGQGQIFISSNVIDPPCTPAWGCFANYQGLWWSAPAGSEAGWGINFAHQGDTIFASWFTYDVAGKGWWLAMTAEKTASNTYSGTLYHARGPPFNSARFDPAKVVPFAIGNGTLAFSDANNGTFAYVVNGFQQTKAIQREMFASPVPTCGVAKEVDLAQATNYQDMWWAAPPGSESGWGINFAHQGDVIFATWFTYDLDGTPLWMSVTARKAGPGLYSGTLYRATGPPFNATHFDAAGVTAAPAGIATFAFADGNSASFNYSITGAALPVATQTKMITRQVFRKSGTVCR